jgi:uncharacterized protein YoxC
MVLGAFSDTLEDVYTVALIVFFLGIGLFGAYALLRLGGVFARLASLIRGTEQEFLPVLHKAGETIDRVNDQLDKVDVVTDSAVSMADSADTAVRAVSTAITTPVKKVSGLASAISHGASALRSRKNVGDAVHVAKEAAARREAEVDEELRTAGRTQPDEPPPAA